VSAQVRLPREFEVWAPLGNPTSFRKVSHGPRAEAKVLNSRLTPSKTPAGGAAGGSDFKVKRSRGCAGTAGCSKDRSASKANAYGGWSLIEQGLPIERYLTRGGSPTKLGARSLSAALAAPGRC